METKKNNLVRKAKPEPIENHDEEYMINCVVPLLKFIDMAASPGERKQNRERNRMSCMNYEQKTIQSEARKRKEPKSQENKQNKRISRLPNRNTVEHVNTDEIQTERNSSDGSSGQ